MTEEQIRWVVSQVLATERASAEKQQDIVVLKVVLAIPTGFGINEDDRKEIREDFIYLRRWRETSESIQRGGWIAVITVLVSGLGAALFLGIKALLGGRRSLRNAAIPVKLST